MTENILSLESKIKEKKEFENQMFGKVELYMELMKKSHEDYRNGLINIEDIDKLYEYMGLEPDPNATNNKEESNYQIFDFDDPEYPLIYFAGYLYQDSKILFIVPSIRLNMTKEEFDEGLDVSDIDNWLCGAKAIDFFKSRYLSAVIHNL